MQNDEVEQAIDEALAGRPRAAELAAMVEALRTRRNRWAAERDAATEAEERRAWDERLDAADAQIRTLLEEQAITEFVENSVRFSLHRPQPEA